MELRILSLDEIKNMITMKQVIDDVEEVYRMKAQNKCDVWPLVSYHFKEQEAIMDIRSGYVIGKQIHGLKMLNNFPHNTKIGQSKFSGMLMVFDALTGFPRGVMDASYITCMRTGAAGALGAKYLANPNAKHALILGAGIQAIFQAAALLTVFPNLKKLYVADPLNPIHAQTFVSELPHRLQEEFHISVNECTFIPVCDLKSCVEDSSIIITITPARSPIIKKQWVRPGTHFSCIGADMEGKEEIDPTLCIDARIFCDDIAQCIAVGELEIPINSGMINIDNIQGEIGELMNDMKSGRQKEDDITIFDATGLALLDLNTANTLIKQAEKQQIGTLVNI